ncbi:hypothetical protein LCL99_08310 [Halomonas denitrificans]|uniref:hypothetical protein n=1 Tax=Halomonas TaxID=2745 RepID=UPI001A8FF31C|nr:MULTISPECIES: hypothetical protein [Halomonas]MED5295795.1 hypothetical protein [Pseudomonadota bacterium]MBN8413836.1 hypothetical protein [Halomonas litopenaei]MBY5926677.1 hypothetical protein [Halomonas sp. DP4Y7-2]MBY5928546.1 hypothetical protein [Halomonas sp. DP8Y7-3]MBY5967716.1 hypothetical protein [Halomonas denitrificans]
MHKHVEWDDPGADSVQRYFADKPDEYPTAHIGSIIAGRYHGYSVRVKVEARVDDDTASIGDVVALISVRTGERTQSIGDLSVGDTVRLGDDHRSLAPRVGS